MITTRSHAQPHRAAWALATLLAIAFLLMALAPQPASAAAPAWQLGTEAAPTDLPNEGSGLLSVVVSNLGDQTASGAGEPILVSATLPAGITATGVNQTFVNETPVVCTVAGEVSCSFKGVLNAYEQIVIPIKVTVQEPAGTTLLSAAASVSGGGGGPVSAKLPVRVSSAPTPFGVASYQLQPLNEDGSPDTQSGGHPFQLTTTLSLNQTSERTPVALPRDLSFALPPGLVGNATATAQCTITDFFSLVEETNLCAANTVVGVVTVVANEPKFAHFFTRTVPVFNLVPSRGEPARLGFEVLGKVPIVIDTSVRSGRDYGVVATVKETTETAGLLSSQLTLWGVPGDPRHNNVRGWECVAGNHFAKQAGKPCPATSAEAEAPFLTLPTSCAADPTSEPVSSTVKVNSWAEPTVFASGEYHWVAPDEALLGFGECSGLPFSPALDVVPEEHTASTPSGVTVDVSVPQSTTLEAGGRAEGDVRDTTVTFPAGVQLSPSSASGLEGCSEAQAGFEGFAPDGTQQFSTAPVSCPDAAKVGLVHIRTPLLSHELEGAVYLADPAPNGEAAQNPFGSLVAEYLIAEDPISGVLVKLAGEGSLDETSGQFSTTFRNAPQVPFENLSVELFGGERAALATPAFCGSYSSSALFTPWSGTAAVPVPSPASDFQITSGVGGGPCPTAPLPFAAAFSAQSSNTAAGGFTNFSVEIARPDGEQALTGITTRLPAGVAALLSTVTPCPEPPAGVEWSCGPASLIGHSLAVSGLGSFPAALSGQVYLTSGYDGAPFGLLVQTRAKAGPFDLGNVNVRSRINVDPGTAAVTITTDPGPRGEVFPTLVRGIPAQIKKIVVDVDREGFEFNPTSCNPMSVTGTLEGSEGAAQPVSSPFQVGGCGALPFAPALSASVAGVGSKNDGTTFSVRVQSGGVGAGGVAQANIAKVFLTLPKTLSTRDSTLKLACLEGVFAANPAACPTGSVIGTATIHTPVLRSALSGPAYLVSHGGAAFPDVEFVLQGEGVTIVLDGKTDIKNGVTFSRFESTPDAPFTTFETVFPAGPGSILSPNGAGANRYDLCQANLAMPTEITAQNGAVLTQTTQIKPTGCGAVQASKTHALTRAQKLAKALKACRKSKNKHKRKACEKQARKRYAPKKAAPRHKPAGRTTHPATAGKH